MSIGGRFNHSQMSCSSQQAKAEFTNNSTQLKMNLHYRLVLLLLPFCTQLPFKTKLVCYSFICNYFHTINRICVFLTSLQCITLVQNRRHSEELKYDIQGGPEGVLETKFIASLQIKFSTCILTQLQSLGQQHISTQSPSICLHKCQKSNVSQGALPSGVSNKLSIPAV